MTFGATPTRIEQARKYYNLIVDKIEYLAANPNTGRTIYLGGKNYKHARVKSHLIFHRKVSSSEIEVIRILHKRMDISNRLSE